MKTQVRKRAQMHGSVLMVTLFIASLFGIFLVYYLNLVRSQSTLVARSQAWNASLAVAEAGVEEALAQLNPGAPVPVINRAANNWGGPANGVYGPMSRVSGNGTYSVVISNDTPPTIYSTGSVSNPAISGTMTRVLRVTTTNTALFSVGMAAKLNINFSGNGVATDSFNSADTNLSTLGRYDQFKTSTNGDIASIGGIVGIANGTVNGSVFLGPTATENTGSGGLITGSIYNDFNVDFEDVVLPQVSWTPAGSNIKTYDNITYLYSFDGSTASTGSGYYTMPGVQLTGSSLYVGTNIHVTLKIAGSTSPVNIRVAAAGTNSGQLTLYMDGPSFTLGGTNIVDGGNALNFTYYGTTNNTQIYLKGNASFTGTIYAPEADFKLGGGGTDIYDFVGASTTKTVTMNGHFNFHYDENLMRAGGMRGYVATSWREL